MSEEKPEEEEGPPPAAGKKKKLILIGAAALVLLLGCGGGAAWFLGVFGGHEAGEESAELDPEEAAEQAERRAHMVFVDMPDVLVNLHALGQRNRFLKLKVALEVYSEPTAEAVRTALPRVMDSFQAYLRALTVDEVSGPGGLHRLKEELTARVNLALAPTEVEDVLIKEMLVQ
jgi:flagellar FliL protein